MNICFNRNKTKYMLIYINNKKIKNLMKRSTRSHYDSARAVTVVKMLIFIMLSLNLVTINH